MRSIRTQGPAARVGCSPVKSLCSAVVPDQQGQMGVPASHGEPFGWREGSGLEKGAAAQARVCLCILPTSQQLQAAHLTLRNHTCNERKGSKSSVLLNPWTA